MPLLASDDPKHGTPAGYQRCKPSCPSCRRANNAYKKNLRKRLASQQEIEERRRRMEEREARRPHECHQVAPEGMSKAEREGFICNDCLDKFQAWLRSIL